MPINHMIPMSEYYAKTCDVLMEWDRVNTRIWKAWSEYQLDCTRLFIGATSRIQIPSPASAGPLGWLVAPWDLAAQAGAAFLTTGQRHLELLMGLQSAFPGWSEGLDAKAEPQPDRAVEPRRRAA